jgi:sulfite exporter TauE/SafE
MSASKPVDINAATTPAAALVAGLATGVHCAGMCGPLVCAVRARPVGYHAMRVVAYALVGGILGALGGTVGGFFSGGFTRVLPWVFVAVLLVMGLGLERRIPKPQFMAALLLRLRLGRWLGIVTPLLPCGPLYLMFGVAVFAGSFASGALLMACFAAGTIPVFGLLQAGVFGLQGRFSPKALRWSQQGLALVAAVLMALRGLPGGSPCCSHAQSAPEAASPAAEAPCCHGHAEH